MSNIKDTELTAKETILLDSIERGMDEPGCGWLHELAPSTHSTSGVLSSLIKKGLVRSDVVQETGYPDSFWVELV